MRIAYLLCVALVWTMSRETHGTEITLLYGQSAEFWNAVGELTAGQKNLSSIQGVLNARYGDPEEIFASVSARAGLGSTGLGVGIHVETMIHGVVQNPVVPEILALQVSGGICNFDYNSPGRLWGAGLSFGLAQERRVTAISTDLVQSVPIREGTLGLLAAHLAGHFVRPLGHGFTLTFDPWFRESVFWTSIQAQSLLENPRQTRFAHRWKASGSLGWRSESAEFGARMGLVLGQQPFAEHPLPHFWDYVTELPSFPSFGALAGVYSELNWGKTDSKNTKVRAGFFGGYLGLEVGFRYNAVLASLSTYGVETSSLYLTQGVRIYSGSLSLTF